MDLEWYVLVLNAIFHSSTPIYIYGVYILLSKQKKGNKNCKNCTLYILMCTILEVHLFFHLFFGTVLYSIRGVNVLELLNLCWRETNISVVISNSFFGIINVWVWWSAGLQTKLCDANSVPRWGKSTLLISEDLLLKIHIRSLWFV